ncbi:helix-turn-helix transcriptional regulator [Arthrobacter oryzae]|uniref:DNA-binding response regulator n=1 Tax=Arthrobacter oryzae TaxID=409290 RepID=A0A3N0BJU5_9MICC|nr:helix-turn-helix transcriptional regulator [Arthrobacter oryzae]RNL48237.1 DNA-binding response regulator [Arthrobacter oryzae]
MSTLTQGREAYAERRWPDAVDRYTEADQAEGLPACDLEQLATSLIFTGGAAEGVDLLARAHLSYLADGDYAAAARCAVWTGMNLIMQGEPARSAGWIARAHRIVEDLPEPCPFEGLLFVPAGLGALYGGDGAAAAKAFTRAADLGRARGDADSAALGVLGLGRAKIMPGDLEDGLALLDEAMVAVTVGEISPVPAGIIYCAVIETCHLAFDLRRAHEWTRALDKECDAQPNLVALSGQCQMHRAELYRLHGAWSEAIAAAKTAQDFAFRGDRMATYGGFYEQGEVQRLRGEFDAAEASYRHAQETGFPPQPGLALLRLAQGRPEQAQTLLRQTMAGIDPGYRRRMLAARVEIELAAGDADAARTAMEELATVCAMIDMPMLHALAEQAQATVLAHDGDPAAALVLLRRAWSRWLSPAAHPHAAHAADTPVAGALTARETEVAQLVSAGLTNRDIAVELFISEKTVARHLSNIFTKLGLTSRAAATADAYQHGLV